MEAISLQGYSYKAIPFCCCCRLYCSCTETAIVVQSNLTHQLIMHCQGFGRKLCHFIVFATYLSQCMCILIQHMLCMVSKHWTFVLMVGNFMKLVVGSCFNDGRCFCEVISLAYELQLSITCNGLMKILLNYVCFTSWIKIHIIDRSDAEQKWTSTLHSSLLI